MKEDIERIPITLQKIIDADGTYFADDTSSRHGVRKEARAESAKNKVDEALKERFNTMVDSMLCGKGIPITSEDILVELETTNINLEKQGEDEDDVEESLEVVEAADEFGADD